MSGLWISPESASHMHVNQASMHVNPGEEGYSAEEKQAALAALLPQLAEVKELSEVSLNAEKAGIRGLIATRLELLWRSCEPFIVNNMGDGLDLRMMQLGLQVLDRQMKIHEVLLPDRPAKQEGVEEAVAAQRRLDILADLEARVASTPSILGSSVDGGEGSTADHDGEEQAS